ncbi:MAG: sugar-binding protein, partial [Verrucomicrobiales bacterium]
SEWTGAALLADPRFSIPKGSGDDGTLANFELNGGDWTGPDDQTSAVQVVYDDDNVYFGFVVTDEYHENANESAWNGDSVQLMVANDARDTQVGLYNYALGGIEGAETSVIVQHEFGPGETEAVVTRDGEAKRTIYEIRLPKTALELPTLSGGVQFGLGMAINDGDEATPGQKGWGGLGAHAIVFGKSPEETALITLAMSNDIEPGKEYYTANPAPGEITIDGDLGDWGSGPILSDPRFAIPKGSGRNGSLALFELNGGDWTGPDDQTSAVQVIYDTDNVYFGFVVTDEYHENANESAWNGDSVQLMIANDKQDTQIALYNYALGGVEGALGSVIVQHEDGPGGTEAIVARNAETKRTTYEIKLPKESMALESLELGTMFGLGMAINDGDEATPGQKGWGGLGAHALVFGKSPEQTALVTLGIGGSSGDIVFLSAINAGLNSFSFRANDKGTSIVDPETATLMIDGQPAALVASAGGVGATDFTHTFAAPYPSGSVHDFTIEVRDTNGTVVSETSTFTAFRFATMTPEMRASQVDMTRPGFIWRVFQNEIYTHNSIAEAELALIGELVDDGGFPVSENNASNVPPFGPAIGPPTVVGPGMLLEFEIPTVINLNSAGGETAGAFGPDDQMPGVPGVNFSSDGADAEIISYIEFPAGFITMGVNSDDGFRAEGGIVEETQMRLRLGEFDGPRGAADTTFLINVPEAGIYPFRAVWQNGGGGANIEIFTLKEDGSKVLLNDVANGGLQTYRTKVGPLFAITAISRNEAGDVTIEWNSKVGADYALDFTTALASEWEELDDGLGSGGATSQAVVSAATISALTTSGRIFFRIREF